MTKLTIAIVCGGNTPERNMSLRSAEKVKDHIPPGKYDAVLYDIGDDLQRFITDIFDRKIDIVFPLVHGLPDDDGSVQGLCSMFDIPYVGSGVHATALCLHKETAKRIMMTHGMLTPKFEIIERTEKLDLRHVQLPCVIKPGDVGARTGIAIPFTYASLKEGLRNAFNHSDSLLIEQLIDGKEYVVGIIGNDDNCTILPVIEIKRVGQSKKIKRLCPADLTPHNKHTIENLSRRAFKAFGASGMLLVRFMYDEQEELFYFIEANTIPSLTPNSLMACAAKNANIEYSELIDKLLQLAVDRKNSN